MWNYLIRTWPSTSIIITSTGIKVFAITDTKIYVLVVPLSTQDKGRQLKKSDFKGTINWNKYQSKVSIKRQNRYLNFLTDPSFQRVNKLFVSSQDNAHQISR